MRDISKIIFIEIPFLSIGKNNEMRTGAGFHSTDFTTSGVPLIKIGNIQNNKINLTSCDHISEDEKKINLTSENDVLVAMRGATSGKLGIVDKQSANCFYVGSVGNLGPLNDELIYPPYLKWLEFQLFEILKEKSKGSAQPMVSIGMLKEYKLRIPKSKVHQKLFCEILEEKLSDIEVVTIEIENQQTLLQQLRQAILQEAVQGKLTKQDPNDEPAEKLLQRIKAEKQQLIAAGKLKKEKELPPITEDEVSFDLPKGWVWCRLGEISDVGTGATPLTSRTDYYNGNIAWVTSSATGEPFVVEAEKYITEKALLETNCKIYPIGTLLIAMYGQGKTRGQIAELLIEAATNQACASIELTLNQVHHKKYIKQFFQKMYEEIRELAAGGAQPNLNLQKIKETIVPLPPLSEQQRIVAKVEQLMQMVNELEQQVQQSKEQASQLLQAVLKEAFSNPAVTKMCETNEVVRMVAAE